MILLAVYLGAFIIVNVVIAVITTNLVGHSIYSNARHHQGSN